ncbi:MAG: hypothetical protein ACK4UN_09610, partial [Limisphaerales bacterium]
DLEQFQRQWTPVWREMFQLDETTARIVEQPVYLRTLNNHTEEKLFLHRNNGGERIPVWLFTPKEKPGRWSVILIHPSGRGAFLERDSQHGALIGALLDQNISVLLLDKMPREDAVAAQRIVMAANYLKKKRRGTRVVGIGLESAGLSTFLAAPAFNAAMLDGSFLNGEQKIPLQGLGAFGELEVIGMLTAPAPLFLFNCPETHTTEAIGSVYQLNSKGLFIRKKERLSDREIADWVASLK